MYEEQVEKSNTIQKRKATMAITKQSEHYRHRNITYDNERVVHRTCAHMKFTSLGITYEKSLISKYADQHNTNSNLRFLYVCFVRGFPKFIKEFSTYCRYSYSICFIILYSTMIIVKWINVYVWNKSQCYMISDQALRVICTGENRGKNQ